MQKITPCLWFNTQAGEAAAFYTSVFKHSEILSTSYYGEGAPMPQGTVLTVSFKLEGQNFLALNGGPMFTFTPAISLSVSCQTQEEVDKLWNKLCQGGEEQRCAWLKDKYGISWQIVPVALTELMQDKDPVKARRVMAAMLTMNKINIQALYNAYEGK